MPKTYAGPTLTPTLPLSPDQSPLADAQIAGAIGYLVLLLDENGRERSRFNLYQMLDGSRVFVGGSPLLGRDAFDVAKPVPKDMAGISLADPATALGLIAKYIAEWDGAGLLDSAYPVSL